MSPGRLQPASAERSAFEGPPVSGASCTPDGGGWSDRCPVPGTSLPVTSEAVPRRPLPCLRALGLKPRGRPGLREQVLYVSLSHLLNPFPSPATDIKTRAVSSSSDSSLGSPDTPVNPYLHTHPCSPSTPTPCSPSTPTPALPHQIWRLLSGWTSRCAVDKVSCALPA